MLALLLNQKVGGLAAYRLSIICLHCPGCGQLYSVDLAAQSPVGLINTVLRMVGIEGPGWLTSEVWSKPAIILMSLWRGSWVIIFLAGLQGVPEQYYEAAEEMSDDFGEVFPHHLPLMTPPSSLH